MRVDENWAIFVEGKRVTWSFGNPDDQFLEFTVNFLQGLGKIAQEIFGEDSVASIESHTGFKLSEVFIVSLQNQFFFICSDPALTLKLIAAKEGLPEAMEEHIAAVLVGQASILFAHSISNAQNETEKVTIENSFQEIILNINPLLEDKISIICSKASSNFSALSFNELLLLHYYIRRHETLTNRIVPSGLVLISHIDGGELPFAWNVERDVVLAGYLAVIIGYIKTLFGGYARRLVFGTHELRKLEFVYGNDYFLAIDSSFAFLCQNPEFLTAFRSVDYRVMEKLETQLKEFLIRETLELAAAILDIQDINSILQAYQGLSEDPSMSINEQIRKIWVILLLK